MYWAKIPISVGWNFVTQVEILGVSTFEHKVITQVFWVYVTHFHLQCIIDNWLVANKLFLNANKTKCVYFKTANSKTPPSDLNLVIRNIPVERVSSVRVLGTIIHENLSRKEHMLALKSKLRATLGAVIRVKPYLNEHSSLSIYHSLVMSSEERPSSCKFALMAYTYSLITHKIVAMGTETFRGKFMLHCLMSEWQSFVLSAKHFLGAYTNSV